jgi:hypothetical protein
MGKNSQLAPLRTGFVYGLLEIIMNNNYNKEDCNRKNFKTPVSWLMGRELLAGLKWIMAYTFMGDKLDSKDWMNAEIITPPRSNNNAIEPYWFDYIADTGDGMSAVYNIAYLCMSELWVDAKSNVGLNNVSLMANANCTQHLPRGEFLFVGGDTAYHIADTASLKERFQTPFNCAAIDIMHSGNAVDQRPIYGVPANHDYYDALDGFNRQFCKPIGQDAHNPLLNDPKDPQLGLLGYERTQTSSYLALQLPFDWWLWGLDSQEGRMDKRQRAFFVSTFYPKALHNGELFNADQKTKILQELQENVPAKLIVTTPEPSTVFGKWAQRKKPQDRKDGIVETFESLGLEPSFLQGINGELGKDKCRLDISGDIHHYERYWGAHPDNLASSNYASVVAGGGGAFLHPSHTDINEVKKQALYPSRKDSHVLITQKILNPIDIFLGGYIWLAGGIIAFLSYFAVTIPESTWSLFKLISNEFRPMGSSDSLLPQVKEALDTNRFVQFYPCCDTTYYYDLSYIVLFIGLLGFWLYRTPNHFDNLKAEQEKLEEADNNQLDNLWNRGILLFISPVLAGFLPLLFLMNWNRDKLPESFLSGLLVDLFFVAAFLLFGLSRRYSDILIKRAKFKRETLFELIPLWVLNVSAITYAVFGIFCYGTYSTSVMSFNLLIVIVWFLATIGLIALAFFGGAKLLDMSGKFRFALIGIWHSLLQISVPVGLALYCDLPTILAISLIAAALTFFAGKLFTRDFLVKELSLGDQKKIGYLLIVAWAIIGAFILFFIKSGDPIAVDGWRLLTAFILGVWFSCIWFGWYLAVTLAFHGHNNEAGGGARSEQYRHMIRFKLTENTLTGYVIGFDEPATDFSNKEQLPKFRLVDVFTIRVQNS